MQVSIVSAQDNENSVADEFKHYVYSVSHDLSAPVRAMVEFSKLLEAEHSEELNAEGKEYLAIIVENGRKMQAMMDGLLSLSRLMTRESEITEFSLGTVIEECRLRMAKHIQQVNAVWDVGPMPVVWADREKILQLFSALLDNAMKFQYAGKIPHIRISAEQQNGCWRIVIADNGIGIHSQHFTRIFRVFQRLHRDEEYQGVGVGLALAEKIVRCHGGSIAVQSEVGGGTSFVFTIG